MGFTGHARAVISAVELPAQHSGANVRSAAELELHAVGRQGARSSALEWTLF